MNLHPPEGFSKKWFGGLRLWMLTQNFLRDRIKEKLSRAEDSIQAAPGLLDQDGTNLERRNFSMAWPTSI